MRGSDEARCHGGQGEEEGRRKAAKLAHHLKSLISLALCCAVLCIASSQLTTSHISLQRSRRQHQDCRAPLHKIPFQSKVYVQSSY